MSVILDEAKVSRILSVQANLRKSFRGHHVEAQVDDDYIFMHIHSSGFSMTRTYEFMDDGFLVESDESAEMYEAWKNNEGKHHVR